MPQFSSYPPSLSDAQSTGLSTAIESWAIANGLVVRPPPAVISNNSNASSITASHAPVTLFPSLFPKSCFEQARAAQETYNSLYAAISRDEGFLSQVVSEVADDFISNLWDIHAKVKQEGYTQPLALGLFRSDYMVHEDPASQMFQVKQIEFNTIASSFGGLSAKTSGMHKYLSRTEYPRIGISPDSLNLPENHASDKLAAGLSAAFDAYSSAPSIGHGRCVLFLTQMGERNVFDQRHLEYSLQSANQYIPVFRLPFSDILKDTEIAATPQRQLLYHPPSNPSSTFEVAVVYLRAGYGPSDYTDSSSWDARYQIERSLAIKCPTVLTQLAGAKKVQQVLATPAQTQATESYLQRFLGRETDNTKALLDTFAGIHPMDTSDAGLEARRKALDAELCKGYVLKPQREGGGNNFYKSAIPEYLKSIPESQWGSYILMELITPPPLNNIILRNGSLESGGVICELGIYGTCLWNQETGAVLLNQEAGYLLRTKGDQSEEGGVAAGFGCMDSCALV